MSSPYVNQYHLHQSILSFAENVYVSLQFLVKRALREDTGTYVIKAENVNGVDTAEVKVSHEKVPTKSMFFIQTYLTNTIIISLRIIIIID